MNFNPQSSMVPAEEEAALETSARRAPRPGLRSGVVAIAATGATTLGVWIWQEMNGFTPATAAAAPTTEREVVPAPDPVVPSAVEEVDTFEAPPAVATEATPVEEPEPVDDTTVRAAEALDAGRAAMAIGQQARARRHLEEAISLDPSLSDARYNLGLVCVLSGDHAAAREQLVALRDLDANRASLLGNLVR